MAASPEVKIALAKIRALQERAARIGTLVETNTDVPREIQIDDKEMLALEEHIGHLAARELGVTVLDKATWRPFWNAAYQDWNRSEGPTRFWVAVNRQLANTEALLTSLSTSRRRGPPRKAIRPSATSDSERDKRKAASKLEPRILVFISHSSADKHVAAALIDLLRAGLNLSARDIRCTSVDGYRLPGGVSTDEQLRKEVHESETFIGLISEQSMASPYVVFELGARWGAGRQLIPLLTPGTPPGCLGGPLQGINALSCDSESQLHQLIADIANALGIAAEPAASYHEKVVQVRGAKRRAGDLTP